MSNQTLRLNTRYTIAHLVLCSGATVQLPFAMAKKCSTQDCSCSKGIKYDCAVCQKVFCRDCCKRYVALENGLSGPAEQGDCQLQLHAQDSKAVTLHAKMMLPVLINC
jgi:hypothetical protein